MEKIDISYLEQKENLAKLINLRRRGWTFCELAKELEVKKEAVISCCTKYCIRVDNLFLMRVDGKGGVSERGWSEERYSKFIFDTPLPKNLQKGKRNQGKNYRDYVVERQEKVKRDLLST